MEEKAFIPHGQKSGFRQQQCRFAPRLRRTGGGGRNAAADKRYKFERLSRFPGLHKGVTDRLRKTGGTARYRFHVPPGRTGAADHRRTAFRPEIPPRRLYRKVLQCNQPAAFREMGCRQRDHMLSGGKIMRPQLKGLKDVILLTGVEKIFHNRPAVHSHIHIAPLCSGGTPQSQHHFGTEGFGQYKFYPGLIPGLQIADAGTIQEAGVIFPVIVDHFEEALCLHTERPVCGKNPIGILGDMHIAIGKQCPFVAGAGLEHAVHHGLRHIHPGCHSIHRQHPAILTGHQHPVPVVIVHIRYHAIHSNDLIQFAIAFAEIGEKPGAAAGNAVAENLQGIVMPRQNRHTAQIQTDHGKVVERIAALFIFGIQQKTGIALAVT